jgi:putative hydrolase of the HAD superfamily
MARSNGDNGKNLAIRAVILDFGEVLCFQPDPGVMGRMAQLFGIAAENFMERYVPTRGPYDQGLLTPEEYWMGFARNAGVTVDAQLVERLRALDLAMWSRINGDMIDWVEALHAAGMTTALLSNMQHDMAAYARKNFAWLRHFDHQLLSCELRLIKPDAAIFTRTIERIGLPPQQTLFVDDREPNIQAAQAIGLKAFHFRGVEDLRTELEGIGFATLPGKPAGCAR